MKWDIIPYLDEIDRQIACGHNMRMIAQSLGVNRRTLSNAMKEHGLPVPTRAESAKHTWENHRHPNLGKRGQESCMYGRKQDPETVAKRKAKISGQNNYHWSGGRKFRSQGYVLVYAPEHPHKDSNGFVLEHRLVMETSIGRFLTEDEIVHHINGDKTDNQLCNLSLTNRGEHARHHMNERYRRK